MCLLFIIAATIATVGHFRFLFHLRTDNCLAFISIVVLRHLATFSICTLAFTIPTAPIRSRCCIAHEGAIN